ncbi:MAG: hypothetical protein P4L53_22365 [Candidatus Obscuribacterales bacterium]|nr:hypothetical protein [Candidatus Obscuribacterales bacterium]
MSTALFLTAFDFEKVMSCRGSNNADSLKAALKALDNLIDQNLPSSVNCKIEKQISAEAKIRLKDFFARKTSDSTTDETAADVLSARALALLFRGKNQPWLNENDESKTFEEAMWSLKTVAELHKQFEQRFEPSLHILFDYLINGRSFSGHSLTKGAGMYAYLTKSEIEEMTILLTRHYKEAFNLLDCGAFCKVDFESSMLEVMESMLLTLKQASEHDLFIIVS